MERSNAADSQPASGTPPFRQIISVFGKIGLLSFGGPAAQIALMHRVLVDEQRWLDERRFLSALSFCMLLPGPEAMQLATYAGWRLHGVKGGLAAGLLFVAARRAARAGAVDALRRLRPDARRCRAVRRRQSGGAGHRAAGAGARRQPRHQGAARLGRAVAAFVAIFFFDLPFPLVIVAAAAAGYFLRSDDEKSCPPGPLCPFR